MRNIDFASCANDNTIYVTGEGEKTKEVIKALENSSKELMQRFSNSQMKANADKCHLLTSSNEESSVCIDDDIIKNSKCGKVLEVNIDQKATFNAHFNNICKKTKAKTKCIVQNYPYTNIPKRCLSLNTFFTYQFSSCPLVLMVHRRSKSHKINYLHERYLRIIYCNKIHTFEHFLDKDGSNFNHTSG